MVSFSQILLRVLVKGMVLIPVSIVPIPQSIVSFASEFSLSILFEAINAFSFDESLNGLILLSESKFLLQGLKFQILLSLFTIESLSIEFRDFVDVLSFGYVLILHVPSI